MRFFAEPLGSRPRLAYLVGAVALIVASLSMVAGRADADQIYWANEGSIAYSRLDDTAGGYLQLSVLAIEEGAGTAIDTANGRIYVSQEAADKIAWFGLDGIGAGVVSVVPGTVDHPTNVAIDPATQTIYWANDTSPGSIGYAYLNGPGGGLVAYPGSTTAEVDQPSRLAIDTRHERLYWWNEGSEEFSWVTTNGLIGGNLTTPGLEFQHPEQMGGIAIEPYSTPEELYFVNDEARGIFHTDPLLGGKPEAVQNVFTENNAKEPTGLVFDGNSNRFYWANRVADEEPLVAIGTATLFGHPGTLRVFPVAPIHNPAFPVILKEPVVVSTPQLSVVEPTLSCSQGEWEGDHPGAGVYAAPKTYSYQWRKGATPIEGATGTSYTATESGAYSCEVIGENAAGAVAAKSRSATVTFPTKPKTTTQTEPSTKSSSTPKSKAKPSAFTAGVKLASGKPVKVKAGGAAVIPVDLVNSGGSAMGSTKVCGKLSKQAKKGLKAPACVTVGSVAAGKTAVAKVKVKTLHSAHGTYKLTVAVSGATTATLTATVQVTAPKGH